MKRRGGGFLEIAGEDGRCLAGTWLPTVEAVLLASRGALASPGPYVSRATRSRGPKIVSAEESSLSM